MHITLGDFSDLQVIRLLELHLAGMHAHTPVCGVHALDLSGLQAPGIDFYTAWDGETLLGCGALRELIADQGEVKSMRTLPQHLRKGVGAAILEHIITIARQRKYDILSLETGSGDAFEPALALYRRYGFQSGAAFGDYEASAFNQFFHLKL